MAVSDDNEDGSALKVDLRGLVCPEPVLRTKRLLDDPGVGQVEALVDGEVSVNNLERLARSLRLKFKSSAIGDAFKVTIERESHSLSEASHSHTKTSLPISSTSDSTTGTNVGTVIFLSKDRFGDGDPEFSANLLNVFLQTVHQSGHRPRAILMANSAVKLMAPGSPTAKVLNDFKDGGCEVLLCGLCVEFYGLKEHVPVGQVTNMFAISEYLFSADKVLTP